MDRNVFHNITDHYARDHDVLDCKNDLIKLIENHDNQPFYIFRYLSLVKNFFIVSKNLKIHYRGAEQKRVQFFGRLEKKNVLYK